MPRLATFIRENLEPILAEWESFARSLPAGDSMDIVALRDHAKEMLRCIAHDLDTPQTKGEQAEKSKGESDADETGAPSTPAQEHGAGRAESGFTVAQMLSELRALRASVIRLWAKQQGEIKVTDLEDMTRFNEAIDQAIAESITQYSEDIGQSKERFLDILGHDLRTPLGAIIMSASFVLDAGKEAGDLGEPYASLIARMAKSARRMNHMVSDLLEFARTRFGDSIPIVRGEMDVRKLVNDVISEVAALYPSSTVNVETSGALRGSWDCDRLTQALTNLLGNAVQHGGEGSPIRVAARGFPDEVVIAVQNGGPVIPKKRLGAIFQATRPGERTTPQDRRHLGLGLYIVDKIVAGHGGSIAVQSSAEEGTTFTVRLPRHVASTPSTPAEPAVRESRPPSSVSKRVRTAATQEAKR